MWIFAVLACLAAPVLFLAGQSLLAGKPDHLGVAAGRLAACPDQPNCVCSQATEAPHAIPPLPLATDAAAALARLRAIVESMPRARVVEARDNYLRAEFTSLLFRFTDDVEFLVDEKAGVVHFRSASRVGYSDLGVNRARMETIRAAYEQAGRS